MSGLAAPVAIVGADGCKAGWAAVMVRPACGPQVAVFGNSRDWSCLPEDAVLAADMPIGLPERTGKGGRGPENLVRRHLGERQSSVFSIRRAAPSLPSRHDPSGHDIEEVAPCCNWS